MNIRIQFSIALSTWIHRLLDMGPVQVLALNIVGLLDLPIPEATTHSALVTYAVRTASDTMNKLLQSQICANYAHE